MPTRFAALSPAAARLLLAAVGLLVALGLAAGSSPAPRLASTGRSDAALYRAIAARSDTLAHYYGAAAIEQRRRHYPLRPFVTVREPALAVVTHRLGTGGTALACRVLALATLAMLLAALRGDSRGERIAAAGLAALAVLPLTVPVLAGWHEAWSGLLLTAAIALPPRACWAAWAIGLVALLTRELALPGIMALAFVAWAEGRYRCAAGWAGVIALFAAALGLHASTVAAHLLPGDATSPGWSGLGGWAFALAAISRTSLFMALPAPLLALLLPLTLLGWAAPATPFTDRAALALAAMLGPLMLFARPENFYWALMIGPLLPIGLAFAPRALADLARRSVTTRWALNAT